MAEKRGEDSSNSIINKLILKKAVNKRIEQVLAKAFISEKEVYDLIRSFFKKHLSIDYEFTREELMRELKKIYLSPELQEKVKILLDDISAVEHSSRTFTREELEQILRNFKDVVDGLIVSHYQQEGSFLKKLKDKIQRAFSNKHKKLLEVDASVLTENERMIVKMNMLLDNTKRLCSQDMEKAKENYSELISLYNSLDEPKKKAYFKPVQELYFMLKNRGG
jgi:hypothetical protein